MTGPQLSLGYWQEEETTRKAFVRLPGRPGVYYRTGDRVRRQTPGKPLIYLGRVDSQIKVLGHRVELGEVESAVRKASGLDGVVALGWPMTASGAEAIEVFLQGEEVDVKSLLAEIKRKLPPYMVPRNIHVLRHLPLNANGKFDRAALHKKLDEAPPNKRERGEPLPAIKG
jgi:Acyl-CoA synthetases (AMP-forming)/AMP-acid ligases II